MRVGQLALYLVRTRPGKDVFGYQALLGQVDDTSALRCQHPGGQFHRRQDSRLQVLVQTARR